MLSGTVLYFILLNAPHHNSASKRHGPNKRNYLTQRPAPVKSKQNVLSGGSNEPIVVLIYAEEETNREVLTKGLRKFGQFQSGQIGLFLKNLGCSLFLQK